MRRSKSEESDEPYLSGAYIRRFVKQLSSSRNMREKKADNNNLERESISISMEQQKPHKKQVRRRLHTRKPYQEKLLNMAEARREIVSALKLHRAAKHAAARPESGPGFQLSGPGFCPLPYSCSYSPPPIFQENIDFVLPNQTLGLNLNLQDFMISTPSSIYSSSSPSSSSSPPPSAAVGEASQAAAEEVVEMKFVGSDEEFVSSPFEEVMEIPTWLNANESWLQHVNDFCYFQDPALPCMDIEEIEGMDGDWLA